jgi:tRNA threonylcarbamoyladenosine biosynthesis protein TsaB
MITLAIDTAFDACSAAIVAGADVLWSERRIIGKGHSEVLPLMVAAGLSSSKVRPLELHRIGVVIGPGAFAGVRVGLAFARAFRIGLKADVVGVASTEALAASLPAYAGVTAIVFDARRGQVYAALYGDDLTAILPPFVAEPQEASARLASGAEGLSLRFAGSGASLIKFDHPHTVDKSLSADPTAIANLAAARSGAEGLPQPLYLRPPDASPAAATLFSGLDA